MRPDALIAANAPNIDALAASGCVSRNCQSQDITLSGPCWSSTLTGVNRSKHLVTSNTFIPNDFATYPHFFARVNESCPDLRTASIVHWAPVNTQILANNADLILTNLTDDAVRDAAVGTISNDSSDLIFVHFDDVDHAGHGSAFSPSVPAYIAAIEQTDSRVGALVAAVQARPTFASEDWLIIVTSDHGGSGTSHGQNIPEHLTTALIISGPSTAIGTVMPATPSLVDVAPTVLTFLGIPIDPAWGWDGTPRGLNMANSPSQPVSCPSRRTLLSENFEAVPLGPSVNEAAATGVWSGSPPTGWTIDDSGVPGATNPSIGVTEWEGWAFTSKSWWVQVAQDQNRSQFTRGIGTVAVADADEWDDRGTPSTLGTYNARLTTPSIPLNGVQPDSVRLSFDSSWRQEGLQRAQLTARFDAGPAITLLDWRSQAGNAFKPDATNEFVRINIPNPAGATAMTLEFALLDAGNNWWWALDNIVVDARDLPCSPTPCPRTCDSLDFNADGNIDPTDVDAYFSILGEGPCIPANTTCADLDFNNDGNIEPSDVDAYFSVLGEGPCL
jgi:hypothetical protein